MKTIVVCNLQYFDHLLNTYCVCIFKTYIYIEFFFKINLKNSLLRYCYLNFSKYRFNNCLEISREYKKDTFDYIMYIHITALHNCAFKNYDVIEH